MAAPLLLPESRGFMKPALSFWGKAAALLTLAHGLFAVGPTLRLRDFGYSPDEDATPAIIRALEAARDQRASKLVLEPGRIHCSNQKALERYLAISNNDNGLSRVVFLLDGFEAFEIDGNGAELVFSGPMVPFVIENSSHVTLRNLSIDRDRPFHTEVQVVASNPKQHTFDIRIDDPYDYAIHHNRIYFDSPRGFYDARINLFFYPEGGGTVHNVNAYKLATWERWVNDFYTAEELEPGLVRITSMADNLIPEPGWIWVIKGSEGERRNVAVRIFRSDHVLFEDVALHHAGGMGIIGEKSENITMTRLQVRPKAGSGRAVSTTADATHFVNCRGIIQFDDCYFSHMLDDATNVHGIYVRIDEILDSRRLGVRRVHYQQHGFDFAEGGDEVEFVDNETLRPVGQAKVTSVRRLNAEYQELSFDRDVAKWIKPGYGIENTSWSAGLSFRNCVVEKNRARGILFSTRGKVVVEDSTFSNMMAAISISGDTNYWFESGPCRDVTIRNNNFVNCTTGGKGNAVIMVAPIVMRPELAEGYYHQNISITDNRFTAFDSAVLYALSVDGLSFQGNQIEPDFSLPSLFPEKPTIEIMASRNVTVAGNQFNPQQNGSVLVDRESADRVIIKDNVGGTGETRIQGEACNRYDVL